MINFIPLFIVNYCFFVQLHPPKIGESCLVEKSIKLNEVLGSEIYFKDICDISRRTFEFQNAGQQGREEKYFNYGRYFHWPGNQIKIKFHFFEDEAFLSFETWERYLMRFSILPSDNMFYEISIMYNGEEYVNSKLKNKFPLKYELYSEIRMDRINYDMDSCSMDGRRFRKYLRIETNFSGSIYNEAGNRSIQLDDTRFVFQIQTLSPIKPEDMPKGEIVPDSLLVRSGDFRKDFETFVSNMDNVAQGEKYGLNCFMWNNKPFIIKNKHYMVFRLPSEKFNEALKLDGSLYFNPIGNERPMKGWIQVPYSWKEKWEDFALESLAYIQE